MYYKLSKNDRKYNLLFVYKYGNFVLSSSKISYLIFQFIPTLIWHYKLFSKNGEFGEFNVK